MSDKNPARARADGAFSASAQRDAQIKDEIAKASAAFDARTAKLKALRLAREEEERAAKAANPPPPAKTRKTVKPRRVG